MKKVLLIGNDINNISNNSTSWEDLLKQIVNISGNNIDISTEKPFPLLYEEIYLKALKSGNINDEDKLKTKIAKIIDVIKPNEIHNELLKLDVDDYVTTNYDYVLEKTLLGNQSTNILKNVGVIRETKYSIFRHNNIEGTNKRFWHIHGEINVPKSITLGFEHYGGQLQKIRDYTVSGTTYKSEKIKSLSFHQRLKKNNVTTNDSWIDFFYKNEVHILGLKLGYEETDLWWLLTNRARFQLENPNIFKNRIIYYCPSNCQDKHKSSIMDAINVEVQILNLEGESFYRRCLDIINNDF